MDININTAPQTAERIAEQIAEQVKWNENGLVPVVVQDAESRDVLMLAYMNKEALHKTLTGGRTCFYSRSRQELWLKGETSGHFQDVVDIRLDCDSDCLLVSVCQKGVACHTGSFSCFHKVLAPNKDMPELCFEPEDEHKHEHEDGYGYEPEPELIETGEQGVLWNVGMSAAEGDSQPGDSGKDLGDVLCGLAGVIARRKREKPPEAYTTYLFEKGLDKILKKIGEETTEVVIAAKNSSEEEIVYEVSDLFYHILVLLEERGVSLASVSKELLTRRK
jgi:phosphoribosyl-ATP pyrophosphohydrolase/phosphoribosyl-AMP cyclohydrolase